MFAHHTWGAAIVGLIATIGWVTQGVGNMYYYRQVRITSLRSMAFVLNFSFADIYLPFSCGAYNGKG